MHENGAFVKNIYCIRPKGFNIGNDIIFLALNHFLRNAFNEVINLISLPATAKYESHKKAGITGQTVHEINQYGHGLVIGGGNLYENGELEVTEPALKALEVPLMLFSLSRGKIYNRKHELVDRTDVMSDSKIVMINKRANVSLTRDHATQAHLDALGCTSVCAGCPTLYYDEMPIHQIHIPDEHRFDALISVRNPALMSIPVDLQFRVREDILELIRILKEKGYSRIRFLCHDHRDIPFAASFREIEYLYTEDVYAYLTFLRISRLNVTYRLHSFLPSLAFGVPAIKISYDQRALSVIESIGMQEWNIDLVKDDLFQEVNHRIANLNHYRNLIEKCRTGTWKKLKIELEAGVEKFAQAVLAS